MSRWILLVTVALALGWSGLWAVSARTLKGDIETWFEARRAEGWQASYADLRVRGFPSRLDATLTELKLNDPARGLGWEAPFFQILGLTYKPGHKILVWPNDQVVQGPSGQVGIASTGLRASVVQDAQGTLLRVNLEAGKLTIDGPDHALTLTDLRSALQQVPGTTGLYRLGLSAGPPGDPDGTLSPGSGRTDELQVQAELLFDQPWTTDTLTGPTPQPEVIDLRLAEVRSGDLMLAFSGLVAVDPQGRPTGETTVRATDWREMLDHARSHAQIPEALARTLDDAFSLAAGPKGNPDTLDVQLNFDEGRVSMGMIPLGQAPRLSLP